MSGPLEMVGADDAATCEDGVCALPGAPGADPSHE